MNALVAASPILVILVLMLGFRARAATAGLAGLAVAAALAVAGLAGETPGVVAATLAGAAVEGAFLAGTILWILLGALSLHALQSRLGAVTVLRDALTRLTGDRMLVAILIGWFFALFLEGVAGFGTPIALAAPLLVGIGFDPVRAVAIALVGHAAGVSFGAVGTPILAQAGLSDLPGATLAWHTALLHGALAWILMLFFIRIGGGASATAEEAGSRWLWGLLAAGAYLAPFVLIAAWLGPELPTIGGALIGGAAFAGVLAHRRNAAAPASGSAPVDAGGLLRAGLPYLVLIALILATRLVPPLSDALAWSWRWSVLGDYGGSIEPLLHPGTLLAVAFLAGGRLQGASGSDMGRAVAEAARRLAPVSVALVAMLVLSRLMLHAGMVEELAAAAVGSVGAAWPAFSPAVGALGSFITGSATASNVLFTSFQAASAAELGLPVALMLAAQGFGAAVGNIICPHNIIAGAATAGIAGREAAILRLTLPVCTVYAGLGGLAVLLLARVM